MNQETIRNANELLREQISELQGEIEVLRARIRVNQRRCKHPDQYQYSAMGELGWKCPDCGRAT